MYLESIIADIPRQTLIANIINYIIEANRDDDPIIAEIPKFDWIDLNIKQR